MEALATKASNHAKEIKAAETQVAATSRDLNKAYEGQAAQIKGAFKEVKANICLSDLFNYLINLAFVSFFK